MRNTLPLCSLPHGKSTSKILWLLAYRKNGTSATVLHAYRAVHETRTKRIMKAITNRTRVGEFIYARLIDQLSLPPPRGALSWPIIEEERQSWEPPMLESQKVARYSTDFSLENARKKIPFSIHILRSFPTFRESAVPLLLFIVLLVVSRELLRTFANKFLIFSTNSNDYRRLDKRQIDLPVWKFRFQSF